jgi:hypothetical protein
MVLFSIVTLRTTVPTSVICGVIERRNGTETNVVVTTAVPLLPVSSAQESANHFQSVLDDCSRQSRVAWQLSSPAHVIQPLLSKALIWAVPKKTCR